jgi:(4S)-4-hydroxy-5-phosphonooxypentane-2,3-dione isomerase
MALAVIATIEIEPGQEAEVLALILAHRERCLRDEPGTLMFELMVPRDEPHKLMLYEVYVDQAAFDVHWDSPSIARLRTEAGDRMKIVSGIWGSPANPVGKAKP